MPNACDPPLLLIFKTAAKITIAVNATTPTTIPTVVAIVLAALLSTDMPATCSLLRPKTQRKYNKENQINFTFKNKHPELLSQVLALKNLLSMTSEDKHVHLSELAIKKFKICLTQGINGATLRCHKLRLKYT